MSVTYRCQRPCKLHKKCFIIKTDTPVKQPIIILYKCSAAKKDIRIVIGGERPP